MPARKSRLKRLDWTFHAVRDLLAIEAYIAIDNPAAAAQVTGHILNKAELLRGNPDLGPSMLPGGPRRLALTRYPYSIYYRVSRSAIRIMRVLHQARCFP